MLLSNVNRKTGLSLPGCVPRSPEAGCCSRCWCQQEIQRTGDIFFPKRWMDAIFSAAAAQVVRTLVDRPPSTYPDRLRWVVLSSADNLFRSARAQR